MAWIRLGLAAADRDEFVAWQQRLDELGISHSTIQYMPLGCHLNFPEPNGIALEFQAPNEVHLGALADQSARSGGTSKTGRPRP